MNNSNQNEGVLTVGQLLDELQKFSRDCEVKFQGELRLWRIRNRGDEKDPVAHFEFNNPPEQ